MRPVGALVIALLLVSACGGEPASAPHDDWRTLLEHLPRPGDDGPFFLTVVDYEAARAALDLERPDDGAPPGLIAEHMVTLQRGPIAEADATGARHSPAMAASYSFFGSAAPHVDEWRSTLGFSALDVDRLAVSFSTSWVRVLEGRIDPDAVTAALTARAGSGGSVAHQGVDYHTWDGLLGPDGWPGALMVADGLLVHANREEDLRHSIEAAQDITSALAGIEEVQLAAEAITVPGAYSVQLVLWPGLFADEADAEALATMPEAELLRRARELRRPVPYQVAAAAAGLAADRPFVMLALVHHHPTAAEVNAVLLEELFTDGASMGRRRPWAELVDTVSIERQGRVTVIRLGTSEPELFSEIINGRELDRLS